MDMIEVSKRGEVLKKDYIILFCCKVQYMLYMYEIFWSMKSPAEIALILNDALSFLYLKVWLLLVLFKNTFYQNASNNVLCNFDNSK